MLAVTGRAQQLGGTDARESAGAAACLGHQCRNQPPGAGLYLWQQQQQQQQRRTCSGAGQSVRQRPGAHVWGPRNCELLASLRPPPQVLDPGKILRHTCSTWGHIYGLRGPIREIGTTLETCYSSRHRSEQLGVTRWKMRKLLATPLMQLGLHLFLVHVDGYEAAGLTMANRPQAAYSCSFPNPPAFLDVNVNCTWGHLVANGT